MQSCTELNISEQPAHTALADVYALLRVLLVRALGRSSDEGRDDEHRAELAGLWDYLRRAVAHKEPKLHPKPQSPQRWWWLALGASFSRRLLSLTLEGGKRGHTSAEAAAPAKRHKQQPTAALPPLAPAPPPAAAALPSTRCGRKRRLPVAFSNMADDEELSE
jgi:hypothetical protein